jgi:tellurite resistance protein TehA-like permease
MFYKRASYPFASCFRSGLEAFFDFCLGCVFYGFGIQFGLIPPDVYRIYTQTRQEIVDSWIYKFLNSNAHKPFRVDTDPNNPISLKYKNKCTYLPYSVFLSARCFFYSATNIALHFSFFLISADEWTKDDFEIVRNMQVAYFSMPLSIAGLALAFKIASKWGTGFVVLDSREIVVQNAWYFFLSAFSAFFFAVFAALYSIRCLLYPRKILKEWMCPLRSNGFGTISISFMLYAALLYDPLGHDATNSNEKNTQDASRIILWLAIVPHAVLSVVKMGEWIGRNLELEHLHAQWMVMPVGLAVAALVGQMIGFFGAENENAVGNTFIARFFFSFAWLMWITLFVVTFFKTVTTHVNDARLRHGLWMWLAAPCVIGLANMVVCSAEGALPASQCLNDFANYYFVGIFIFLALCWATLPQYAFFGSDEYGSGYWIECFALDTLAACACFFYAATGFKLAETLQFIFLTIASLANLAALLHFVSGVIRRRGVFTPEVKWGPLSFMKLTHEGLSTRLRSKEQFKTLIVTHVFVVCLVCTLQRFEAHCQYWRIRYVVLTLTM